MSVVVQYVDLDNNLAELASSGELTGNVGERIEYSTADEIEKLTNQNYVLINNTFDPNNDVHFFDQSSKEYQITFKHAQEEITANNLKYGCQKNEVQIKGKQVVHYTGIEEATSDNVVEVTFNRRITYDKVTKQKISISAWQPEKFNMPLIATPFVLNYTPDKVVMGGEAVTPQNLTHEYVVTYLSNKRNARRQKAEIKFIDVEDNNSELATSGELKGKPGKEINYDIADTLKDLTQRGYELVNNNFDSNDKKPVFGNSRDSVQTFFIVMKHKKQLVNSDHPSSEVNQNLYEKEVHRTISFIDASDKNPKDVVQTAKLKRNLTLDLVTKKLISAGKYTTEWRSEETFPPISVPVVAAYHTKVKEVAACPVNNQDVSEEIKYYKNGYLIPVDMNNNVLAGISKEQLITNSLDPTEAIFPKLEVENIKFKQVNDVKIADPGRDYYVPFLVVHRYIAVDEDHPRAEVSPAYYKRIVTARVHYQGADDKTPEDAKQIVHWTRTVTYDEVSREVLEDEMYTTKWTADKDIFEATPTPVIKGYCADIGLIGEHPITETDLLATVTYYPIGTMIPVDEHNNEIQGAHHFPYINDPYDPVRVLITEEVPEVEGYAPVKQTITVNDPFKDIRVPYVLKPRYIPVDSEHPYRPINPTLYSVPVKEVIKYQGAGDKTPHIRMQAAKWTRTLTVNENNSELIENGKYTTPWTVDKDYYTEVRTPVIDGYHADKNLVEEMEVKKANYDVSVTYKQNGQIIPVDSKGKALENVERPFYVTDPSDATKVMKKQGVPRILNYVPEREAIVVRDADRNTEITYYTFNEWNELSAKVQDKSEKKEDLETKQSKDNKSIKEKNKQKEEKTVNLQAKEKKLNKKDTNLKSVFSWLK
ncbi:hypothetical protein NSA03_04400 [Lactobacillus taiwanensis]|uniref:mucin-binding protein n=1 Tax=Lactobacillus taiwanensis TaxID=508451 RepID=UPI00214B973B|nr:hypothetical protein [Lactobacillus taiwanensis]MCR1916543.1 hypothetical protein [Lactobacillus taiwanensis]